MDQRISRRAFGTVVAGSAVTAASGAMAVDDEPARDYPAPKFTPQFKKAKLGVTLTQDFVIFAHSDLDMVKLLLDKNLALLNTTVDWGGGDWESALGGASHMGRRDIAEFLLDRGARMDLFCAAMLGNLDVVKGMLAAQPKLIDAKGPHGIPLLTHAKMGGKQAEAVYAFLEEKSKK